MSFLARAHQATDSDDPSVKSGSYTARHGRFTVVLCRRHTVLLKLTFLKMFRYCNCGLLCLSSWKWTDLSHMLAK